MASPTHESNHSSTYVLENVVLESLHCKFALSNIAIRLNRDDDLFVEVRVVLNGAVRALHTLSVWKAAPNITSGVRQLQYKTTVIAQRKPTCSPASGNHTYCSDSTRISSHEGIKSEKTARRYDFVAVYLYQEKKLDVISTHWQIRLQRLLT